MDDLEVSPWIEHRPSSRSPRNPKKTPRCRQGLFSANPIQWIEVVHEIPCKTPLGWAAETTIPTSTPTLKNVRKIPQSFEKYQEILSCTATHTHIYIYMCIYIYISPFMSPTAPLSRLIIPFYPEKISAVKSHFLSSPLQHCILSNIPKISYQKPMLYINMYTFTYINIYMANLR